VRSETDTSIAPLIISFLLQGFYGTRVRTVLSISTANFQFLVGFRVLQYGILYRKSSHVRRACCSSALALISANSRPARSRAVRPAKGS
jgi:hypothetical protein